MSTNQLRNRLFELETTVSELKYIIKDMNEDPTGFINNRKRQYMLKLCKLEQEVDALRDKIHLGGVCDE